MSCWPFENSGWPQILELAIVRHVLGAPSVVRLRYSSAALQCVRGACRRPLVLVAQLLFSQVPKFSFATFGPTSLLPKLIRSSVDFLFAGFSHDVFSELSTAPFRRVGDLPAGRARPAWRLAFRIQVHMKPLVPRQDRPTRQRPGGRYTAWPWPGLSRSSRGFRLRQQNREPAEMFRPTREPHGERCGKQDRGGHLKKPRRHVFRRSGANEIRTACAGTGCNRI